MGLTSPTGLPYDGADYFNQHTQTWFANNYSGDTTVGYQRDTLVARARDLVRNDAISQGIVTRSSDNTIGINFRPLSRPDWRALRFISGNTSYDEVWAQEFAEATDSLFKSWANSGGHWNDVERQRTFGQQMYLAFKSLIIDGDCLALLPWMEERMFRGGAKWATAVQLIDTDRLSNPNLMIDEQQYRNGVEINPETGEPIAYWIRQGHYADWWALGRANEWERYPKETSFGRPNVVHLFMADRIGQHRGGAGIFAPVIIKLKQIFRLDEASLDSAILQTVLSAYIKTPNDPMMMAEALGTEKGWGDPFGNSEHHQQFINNREGRNISFQNARLPILNMGEDIVTVSPSVTQVDFDKFSKRLIRQVAQAVGLSPQQVSGDYGDVNYSSARAAILEAQKTMLKRRKDFEVGFAHPIFQAWLEEAMDAGDLPFPAGGRLVSFDEGKDFYSAAKWLGPAQGWVDPVKEKQGIVLGLQNGMGTLASECADQEGESWQAIADQQAKENRRYKELGLISPYEKQDEKEEVSEEKKEVEDKDDE
ncbi:phage portal protein [Acetobacteraceae bacterium]|nr:phage portal protein [Acetobacteraceae bacterium]